ncbi:MAG TPA: hypothetical protein DCM86_02215 [Verrucomicrobiales bacterium]|nr:hypothetical protein [Verrucomicrobiales bacterium]
MNPSPCTPPPAASGGEPSWSTADLRRLTPGELERLGQQSLREHLAAQAAVARELHGPVDATRLPALLRDPACLRHPVRLVYELGEMAMHQFAHPDIDWRNTAEEGRVIYLRPALRSRPDLLPLAVAYMIPVVNYGQVVTDAHCLVYAATLLGLAEEECYRRLCALADSLGAEPRPGGCNAVASSVVSLK